MFNPSNDNSIYAERQLFFNVPFEIMITIEYHMNFQLLLQSSSIELCVDSITFLLLPSGDCYVLFPFYGSDDIAPWSAALFFFLLFLPFIFG